LRALIGLAAWLLVPAAAAPVSAQAPAPVTVRPYGTVQVQYSTTSVEPAQAGGAHVVPSTFEMRRVRLGADIRIGDALTGRIEPELAMGQLRLRNAWLEYAVGGAWGVRAGQFKKPFGLLQLTSNTRVPTIERAVRIRGLAQVHAVEDAASGAPVLASMRNGLLLGDEQVVQDVLGYHGYDIGAMLHGTVGRLGVQAGLFNGNGADQLDDTGAKSGAARLTYAVAGPVVLGAAASYRETLLDGPGTAAVSGWAWTVDAEAGAFRQAGPALLAAFTAGDNFAAADRFIAAHAMATWFAPARFGHFEGVEAVARVGYADPRRGVAEDEALLLTPGLNLYLTGRNRLMVNWDVFVPQGDRFSTQHALRVQAQLAY
jgi:hypothetical protein